MVVVCLYTYCICLYSLLSIALPVLANKLVHIVLLFVRNMCTLREQL